jgi:hypothetical protein
VNNEAAREMTICKAIVGILVNVITVFMLSCTICTGFRLATEPRGDSRYHFLTFSIGLVTIVFGSMYFIIGLAMILELALDLSSQLQQTENKGGIHKRRSMIVNIFCLALLL